MVLPPLRFTFFFFIVARIHASHRLFTSPLLLLPPDNFPRSLTPLSFPLELHRMDETGIVLMLPIVPPSFVQKSALPYGFVVGRSVHLVIFTLLLFDSLESPRCISQSEKVRRAETEK